MMTKKDMVANDRARLIALNHYQNVLELTDHDLAAGFGLDEKRLAAYRNRSYNLTEDEMATFDDSLKAYYQDGELNDVAEAKWYNRPLPKTVIDSAKELEKASRGRR